MELNLTDFVGTTVAFSVENKFIVASDHMSTKHDFWLADNFEDIVVERGLYDAVIELQDHHVLLIAALCLSNQLCTLYLIIVEASTIMFEHSF